jgi:hypothetical protein
MWRVNGRMAVLLAQPPQRVFCSDLKHGDVSLFLKNRQTRRQVKCDIGMATGLAEYSVSLPPGAQGDYVALMPLDARKTEISPVLGSVDYEAVRHSFKEAWKTKLAQSAELEFPDKKLTQSFRANRAFLQMFDRAETMTPGVLTYGECWIRDSAYMIHALDKVGFHEQAEQKLVHLPQRQMRDGYFVFQEGEWDANGLAIWTIVQHYRLTGNRDLLKQLYAAVLRGAFWIERKRQQTRQKPSSHFGLLPAGLSAEHLGPSDFYYWDYFLGSGRTPERRFCCPRS